MTKYRSETRTRSGAVLLLLVCIVAFCVLSFIRQSKSSQHRDPDPTSGAAFRLYGPITIEKAEHFSRSARVDTLTITSQGGDGMAALKIAELMTEWDTKLIISGLCMSACAEFLMPAAKEVIAVDLPIIAVHGNPFMLNALFEEAGIHQPEHCLSQLKGLRSIYNANARLTDLAMRQADVLDVLSFHAAPNADTGCYTPIWYYRNSAWMPTSEQFSELMNVEILGDLCADRPSCIEERIKKIGHNGRCVVVDEIIPCFE